LCNTGIQMSDEGIFCVFTKGTCMKTLLIFVLVLSLSVQIFAIPPEKKELLLANAEKSQKMMAELEKTVVEKKAIYEKALAEYQELEKQLKSGKNAEGKDLGYFAKKKLEGKVYLADRKAQKLAQEYRKENAKLLVYYCVAGALEKRKLSNEELEQAKHYTEELKKGLIELNKKLAKAKVAKYNADIRLGQIPKEMEEVKAKLAKK